MHQLLHHGLPLIGIFALAFVLSNLFTPVDLLMTFVFHWGSVAVGMGAYVLGINIGRQTDPLRPRYLRLRVPRASESIHVACMALLTACVTLGPVAYALRDGWRMPGTSMGLVAIQKTLLNAYWGPITLGLMLLAWLTRSKRSVAACDE